MKIYAVMDNALLLNIFRNKDDGADMVRREPNRRYVLIEYELVEGQSHEYQKGKLLKVRPKKA